jgi:aerobic carbon-monoxide dehydrogenase small subunit
MIQQGSACMDDPGDRISMRLNVNGEDRLVTIGKRWTLLYVLRELLNLTGTKYGCGTGDCGACKVLLDGEPTNSCTFLAARAEGKLIITVEGIASAGQLSPIQQAFVDAGAVQCGFCTPGMIITATALLHRTPNPSREEIVAAFDNNLCRCTGYVKIIEAIELAAQRTRGEG